jgi:hypothetical protein
MLWGLVLQGLVIVQNVMGMLVNVNYHFNRAADGQWQNTQLDATVTAKGEAIINAIATVLHHGMDFIAQLTVLLPAESSIPYSFN